jgi:hypothetical protein
MKIDSGAPKAFWFEMVNMTVTWSTKLQQKQIQENHLKSFSLFANPHYNIFIFSSVRFLAHFQKTMQLEVRLKDNSMCSNGQ